MGLISFLQEDDKGLDVELIKIPINDDTDIHNIVWEMKNNGLIGEDQLRMYCDVLYKGGTIYFKNNKIVGYKVM